MKMHLPLKQMHNNSLNNFLHPADNAAFKPHLDTARMRG
jgi:hypothetical protein